MFTNNKKETIVKQEVNQINNIIGQGTTIEGNIKTQGNMRIEGKVVGEVTTKAKIVLGCSAKIKGNIVAQNAEIGGEIQGVVETSALLILKPTAVVQGDIIANKLIIEADAQFNGKCKMVADVAKEGFNRSFTDLPPKMNGKNDQKMYKKEKISA